MGKKPLFLKIKCRRVHAVAQTGVTGAVVEHMAQMGIALAAYRLGARAACAGVHALGNRAGAGQREAGPAAASVKLGIRVKQLGTAAHAVVCAVSPVHVVLAGERAFGGGLAGDLVGQGLCALVLEQGLPLGGGFIGSGHEEQLIAMEAAQAGGKVAKSSNPGCSSNGDSSRRCKVDTPVKSFLIHSGLEHYGSSLFDSVYKIYGL